MGASEAIQALYMKVLMQRNFVAKFHPDNASFTRKTASYSVSKPPYVGA